MCLNGPMSDIDSFMGRSGGLWLRREPCQGPLTLLKAARDRRRQIVERLGRMGAIYMSCRPEGRDRKLERRILAAMASRMMLSIEKLPALASSPPSSSSASPHRCSRLINRGCSLGSPCTSPPASIVSPATLGASPDDTTFLYAQSERPKMPLLDSPAARKVRASSPTLSACTHHPPHRSSCKHVPSISHDASTRCWVGASRVPSLPATSILRHATFSRKSYHSK